MEKKYILVWWLLREKIWTKHPTYWNNTYTINEAHIFKAAEEKNPAHEMYSYLVVEHSTDLDTLPPPPQK